MSASRETKRHRDSNCSSRGRASSRRSSTSSPKSTTAQPNSPLDVKKILGATPAKAGAGVKPRIIHRRATLPRILTTTGTTTPGTTNTKASSHLAIVTTLGTSPPDTADATVANMPKAPPGVDLNCALKEKLSQMGQPLMPLVQMTTGQVHPRFPKTLLSFWLLTETELDDLAFFYHQSTLGYWTFQYPCPIWWFDAINTSQKRRKFGKFIGLRGCETPLSPTAPQVQFGPPAPAPAPAFCPGPQAPWPQTEEQIMEEARRARLAETEDEAFRKKAFWYH